MVRSSTILACGSVTIFALALSISPPPEGPLNPPGDPAEVGQWLPPQDWEVIAIHSAVLPTGKVLQYAYPSGGSKLWDPVTGRFQDANVDSDLFCSGLSFLPDGALFVTGGNDYGCQFQGRAETHSYNPFDEAWVRLGDMADGRWYPTNVELGDGRTLIFTGLDRNCQVNTDIELYTPGVGLEVVGTRQLPLFPNMHLLSNGRVAYVGPSSDTFTYNVDTNSWQFIDNTNWGVWRGAAPSVLIPGRTDEIMILGGGPDGNVTATCEIIDFKDATPQWRYTAPLNHARKHFDTLILPDKTVFVCGGGLTGVFLDPVFIPELFDPATESWIDLPPHQYGRMYHATTVLLPDGRVLVAGQNDGPSAFKGEIYLPRYFFRGDRPEISSAPRSVGYGGAFVVESDQAEEITSVCLISLSANTHSLNTTQRYVELPFQLVNSNTLLIDAPPDGKEAPPGYYMMFIRNGNEVPSVAAMVHIGPPTRLTSITVLDGTLISGGLVELTSSDDAYLETEARVTGEVAQPHLLRMRIDATTEVPSPSMIDLTLESHITDVEATVWLSLRDWDAGRWERVGRFTVGMQDEVHRVAVPDAARFVRAGNGRIVLRIKKIVFFPFTLGGFHSLIDHVEIAVR